MALARPMWSLQRPSMCTQQVPAVNNSNNNSISFQAPSAYASRDAWVQALAEKDIAVIEADDDCMSTDDESY